MTEWEMCQRRTHIRVPAWLNISYRGESLSTCVWGGRFILKLMGKVVKADGRQLEKKLRENLPGH